MRRPLPQDPPQRFPSPKGGGLGWVDLDTKTKRRWSVFSQLVKRLTAVTRMIPYVAAQHTYYGLMERIPGGPMWSRYRARLELTRFGGSRARIPTFGVYARPKPLEDRQIDGERHVLYIRPRRTYNAPVSQEVRVLHRYSPWTTATLPFSPQRNQAIIVVRRVTKREVQKVTEQRKKDHQEWRKHLEAAGVKNIRVNNDPLELKAKIIHDISFDALRREFGHGGTKPVPHWRPSIYASLTYLRSLLRQRSFLSEAITNPRYSAWKKWPPRAESSIKIDGLKGIQKFEKRLRIRV
jgi:hypothetical protein